MTIKPEVLAELKPGANYVIELAEHYAADQQRNILTSLERWGKPRGISFLVLPRGMSIVRAGRLRRPLIRWFSSWLP